MTEPTTGDTPQCLVRLGEPCRMCVPSATGPDDCGLAYLVMTDPELREQLLELMREHDLAAAAGAR